MEEEKNKENEEIIEDVNIEELRHYEEEEEG